MKTEDLKINDLRAELESILKKYNCRCKHDAKGWTLEPLKHFKKNDKTIAYKAADILTLLDEFGNDRAADFMTAHILKLMDKIRATDQKADGHFNAGKNKAGKISYNPADVLKFLVSEYLKEEKNNPKFTGIYDGIMLEANQKSGLSENSNTLKKAFPHSRIKKEILKLKRIDKKTKKTAKKKK